MAEETNLEGNIVYKCLSCGWLYESRLIAEECETWCKKHKSCNLEIVENAIKLNEVVS